MATTYFHVDRSSALVAGTDVIADRDYTSCSFYPVQDHFHRSDLEALVDELFPGGMTRHGKQYLLSEPLVIRTQQGPLPAVPHIPMIELISELVRRLLFPERPSRLTALFAWESLDEAIRFRNETGGGKIYHVEANEIFRGDMKLLLLGGSGVGAVQFARKYWRGDSSPQPRWEYLLVPPVRVIAEAQ